MAFFEKVGETISTKGKEAAQRAKGVADLAKLNTQVGQLEGKIKTYYQIIGEKVYQKEKDQDHAGLEAEFTLINDAVAEIARIKKQISDIRGTRECAGCGAEVDNSFAYCPHCGAKFEEPAADACCGDSAEECGCEEASEACGCEEAGGCGEADGECAEETCDACGQEAAAEETCEACSKEESAE